MPRIIAMCTKLDGRQLILLVTAVMMTVCAASDGDRQHEFQSCISDCTHRNCVLGGIAYAPRREAPAAEEAGAEGFGKISFAPLPWLHRGLLMWDCSSECQHQCMVMVESLLEAKYGAEITRVKYFGKWPFQRICGMQEFMSVLLSLGNLWPHLLHLVGAEWRGALTYGESTTQGGNERGKRRNWMATPLRIYGIICVNTWIW
mmetsp:Transcript_39100/g.76250  ORF Transcript_39100/g.76250 Transcript_39100/m.76250 type:complete len:203 (-) Transcript_39100:924-1532(-)